MVTRVGRGMLAGLWLASTLRNHNDYLHKTRSRTAAKTITYLLLYAVLHQFQCTPKVRSLWQEKVLLCVFPRSSRYSWMSSQDADVNIYCICLPSYLSISLEPI